MSKLKKKFEHKPEYNFDLVLDATEFYDTDNPAGHIGTHVEIIENMIEKPEFHTWLLGFLKYYGHVDKDKPVVRVLVLCPRGTKRSVACAEMLKYIVQEKGMLCDTPIKHLSIANWEGHCRLCSACGDPQSQPRRKEVLEKTLQLVP